MPPAARISDYHVCPMVTGTVPHVGGPIVTGAGNVIIGGMPAARVTDIAVCIGPPDMIAMGSATVYINGLPAARMGDPKFVKRFRAAERPGVYCRVIRPGPAAAGEAVRREPSAGRTITVLEMFRDHYDSEWDETKLRRRLAAPIAIRAREDAEERLARLMGS